MRPQVVLRYVGFVHFINALFMLITCMLSAFYSDSGFFPLLYGGMISALFGVFPIIFVPKTTAITNKEGFIIVILSWLFSCLVGLMPYILWGGEFTLANAWFESVSGYTTTGSTILTNVEALPNGLLFWRAATHWIGGSGIIIFVLSVLPSMGRAGMILYRTEMSAVAMDNFKYRTRKALQILIVVYVGLTTLETFSLLVCGMNLFDAVTHAFATIATGGFSTKNLSIAYYNSVSIEIVTMIFMVLSGVHFALLFAAISGGSADLFRSTVVRYYLAALLIGTLITTFNVHGDPFESWADALRYASFQIISVGTSTGFATADTSLWPPLAMLLLIFFTLQCACAGSTSGGIKVDRIVFFWKALGKRIKNIQHPRAVITPKIDHVSISNDMSEMNLLYIVLYLTIVFISSAVLSSLGVDSLTAFTGSAATMGNVGPGFGLVGSMGNFSQIPDAGKWVLTADMLLGRLEIFGLIIFFISKSWK
ncbi:MAG: TrkH family potassium uptake protein [Desulfobacteraceae bacterium]|nr:TrkH family potassium uptake protein [Desulfobacteraceae bacterium]